MKRFEILFDWPIREITRLTNSPIAESYADDLTDDEQHSFIQLTEKLRGFGLDLENAKNDHTFFSHWEDLREIVINFEKDFSSFPEHQLKKIQLTILLAEKLIGIENLEEFTNDEIDVNAFEIRKLGSAIDQAWFSRQNNSAFENSIVVFSFDDMTLLQKEVAASIITPRLAYHFLAALHSTIHPIEGHHALIKNVRPTVDDQAVDSFVRLSVLASGKIIHTPQNYNKPLQIIDADIFQVGELYQQWNEVHTVLSEYNDRTETLLKYLTIYHVIENFMFKFPIVDLERKNDGKMFSIRDFRRLYTSTETSETGALKRLFDVILKEKARGLVTFDKHLTTRWKGLIVTQQISEMNTALALLGIKQKYAEFNATNCAEIFSKIVYQVRCAIVHNKETEFHLTHSSFNSNNSFRILIEDFLLPSLEEICYSLIGKKNQHIWYGHKELQLYN